MTTTYEKSVFFLNYWIVRSVNRTLGLNSALQVLLIAYHWNLHERQLYVNVLFVCSIFYFLPLTVRDFYPKQLFILSESKPWPCPSSVVKWTHKKPSIQLTLQAYSNKDTPLHYSSNSRSHAEHWFTCVYINNHFHTLQVPCVHCLNSSVVTNYILLQCGNVTDMLKIDVHCIIAIIMGLFCGL